MASSLTPEQRKELLRKGFNLSRIERTQPVAQKDEEPTLRNMTEEERKRLPYVRDASDPLAWGEEPGVQEDETTWEVLGAAVPGAIAAKRFAGSLAKKSAALAEAKAARNAAQVGRFDALRDKKRALAQNLRDEMNTSNTLRGHLDTDAGRIADKRRRISHLEEQNQTLQKARSREEARADNNMREIWNLENKLLSKGERLGAKGGRVGTIPPARETPEAPITRDMLELDPIDAAPDNPALIRSNMQRNIEEAGKKELPEDFKTNWREAARGRPWPDFVSAGGIPLEHKGKTYRITRHGGVYDEANNKVLRMGSETGPSGVTSTNYTFYEGATPRQRDPKSGLAKAVRKKLAEIHGTITSDASGRSSALAQQSWERTPGAIRRTLPEYHGGVGGPQFVLRHPEGGAMRKIVDDLVAEEMRDMKGTVGKDYEENLRRKLLAELEPWLKKYGGKAALGSLGLEALRRHLESKRK
jgi:hypothetical protein